jgi:hypothetical protein
MNATRMPITPAAIAHPLATAESVALVDGTAFAGPVFDSGGGGFGGEEGMFSK